MSFVKIGKWSQYGLKRDNTFVICHRGQIVIVWGYRCRKSCQLGAFATWGGGVCGLFSRADQKFKKIIFSVLSLKKKLRA